MKKFFLILLLFYDVVNASSLLISKKDIDTGEYSPNCDFLLYDSYGNVVDSWVQDYSYHISNVQNGYYKLVSRPYIMGSFNDDLSSFYTLNVVDDLTFTVYDKTISTPLNLKSTCSNSGFFLIGVGLILVFFSKYSYN